MAVFGSRSSLYHATLPNIRPHLPVLAASKLRDGRACSTKVYKLRSGNLTHLLIVVLCTDACTQVAAISKSSIFVKMTGGLRVLALGSLPRMNVLVQKLTKRRWRRHQVLIYLVYSTGDYELDYPRQRWNSSSCRILRHHRRFWPKRPGCSAVCEICRSCCLEAASFPVDVWRTGILHR